MTAAYAREREQFDRPIGSFQAVSAAIGRRLHRHQGLAADADAGGLAGLRGLRRPSIDVATAAFWAADAGHRVAHTIGARARRRRRRHRPPGAPLLPGSQATEFALGGATGQLRRIGRELAETPA